MCSHDAHRIVDFSKQSLFRYVLCRGYSQKEYKVAVLRLEHKHPSPISPACLFLEFLEQRRRESPPAELCSVLQGVTPSPEEEDDGSEKAVGSSADGEMTREDKYHKLFVRISDSTGEAGVGLAGFQRLIHSMDPDISDADVAEMFQAVCTEGESVEVEAFQGWAAGCFGEYSEEEFSDAYSAMLSAFESTAEEMDFPDKDDTQFPDKEGEQPESDQTPQTAAVVSVDPRAEMVQLAHLVFLQHQCPEDELGWHLVQLALGDTSNEAMVGSIAQSEEALQMQSRSARAGEFSDFMSMGTSEEALQEEVFVQNLWHGCLGHGPTVQEWSEYARDLREGAATRAQLLHQAVEEAVPHEAGLSLGNGTSVSDMQFVRLLFMAAVGRLPSDAESEDVLAGLESGEGREDIATLLCESEEVVMYCTSTMGAGANLSAEDWHKITDREVPAEAGVEGAAAEEEAGAGEETAPAESAPHDEHESADETVVLVHNEPGNGATDVTGAAAMLPESESVPTSDSRTPTEPATVPAPAPAAVAPPEVPI